MKIKRICKCGKSFFTYDSPSMEGKGIYCSIACRIKYSIHPSETKYTIKKKMGVKGKRHSIKTEFKKGMIPWNKGKINCFNHTKKWKEMQGKRISRENHPNWQGGKSFEPYPLGWTKTFREQIRYRDGYRCQECGIPEIECIRKLHVHHIDDNKKNIKPSNLTSLCNSCHLKLHWKLNKDYNRRKKWGNKKCLVY